MGEARIREMHACERHAYGMAYARCTPMRDTLMRCAYEMAAYEMAYERGTHMRCTPMRWPMGEACL
jgi:hypothetical protein